MNCNQYIKDKLFIVDTTLRDGEQSPGVTFSIEDKKTIAKALDNLGVDVIEAGIPIMGKDEAKAIYEILNLNLKAEILTWNRMKYEDVRSAIVLGAKNIHISVPASDIHIFKKLSMTKKAVLDAMKKVIDLAIQRDCKVSIGAEDASRADFDFLVELYQTAEREGASRIRYADTVSVLSPFTAEAAMRQLRQHIKVPIDFHGHNDFGLGTGNALGAFRGGAKFISCSINGLGERAGNTPLEEIVLAIKYMEDTEVGIHLNMIPYISHMVEQYSGRLLHHSKPIVGKVVFSHEAGIHVDGLLKDSDTYEYLKPSIVGRDRQFVFGKHSGKHKGLESIGF